jgi:hypothetical protein
VKAGAVGSAHAAVPARPGRLVDVTPLAFARCAAVRARAGSRLAARVDRSRHWSAPRDAFRSGRLVADGAVRCRRAGSAYEDSFLPVKTESRLLGHNRRRLSDFSRVFHSSRQWSSMRDVPMGATKRGRTLGRWPAPRCLPCDGVSSPSRSTFDRTSELHDGGDPTGRLHRDLTPGGPSIYGRRMDRYSPRDLVTAVAARASQSSGRTRRKEDAI